MSEEHVLLASIPEEQKELYNLLDAFFTELASLPSHSINVVTTVASLLQMYMGRVSASNTLFGATVPYNCLYTDEFLAPFNVGESGYVSSETAIAMADKAQRDMLNTFLERSGDDLQRKVFIGLGATAAIRSKDPKKGSHRVIVTAKIGSFRTIVLHLEMVKGLRERKEEDEVASLVMVLALQMALDFPLLPTSLFLHPDERVELISDLVVDPLDQLLKQEGGVQSVLFMGTTCVGTNVTLPPGTLVYPGSYNPFHEGHLELATGALKKCTPLDEKQPLIVFEISALNVDKPSITYEECQRRIDQITAFLFDFGFSARFGIIFTMLPKFTQKCEAFPNIRFVLGVDTLSRILDPVYCGTGESIPKNLSKIVCRSHCRFVVGGRHDKNGNFCVLTPEYLETVLPHFSMDFYPEDAFLGLTEEEFCVQVSSSEIRAEKKMRLEGGAV
jgi:hypothetical protein